MNELGYSVFVRDIKKVGYEKRTSKRNVFFKPLYRIDENNFKVIVDHQGKPVLDEEFSDTVVGFREWVLLQEDALQRAFLKEG